MNLELHLRDWLNGFYGLGLLGAAYGAACLVGMVWDAILLRRMDRRERDPK